jgi:hypothetical protein
MNLSIRLMGNPIITFGEIVLTKGTCCICGSMLYDVNVQKGHFSAIQIFKKAKWKEPTATLTTREKSYVGFAVALICSQCEKMSSDDIKELQNSVKFAVELDLHKKTILYHDVKELEDYPVVIA